MAASSSSPLSSLSVKADSHTPRSRLSPRPIRLGKLPRLIIATNTAASPAVPRITTATAGAQKLYISTVPVLKAPREPETGVYQTLESTTRFAIIVPPSASRACVLPFQPLNKQNSSPIVPTPIRLRRSITVQRLGMQTPSPPWAVRYMSTRGGGRFNLMSLADFHRPASERLAVQHVEGKGDVVPAVCLKLVRKGTHTRQTVDAELAPEQLKTFKYLVTENTRLHHLESMAPLKLAVHNNLARALAVSSCHRHQVGNSASKPKSSQHMRRTRPILLPLDTDAARAYTSTNPGSDSPPDSPGPATPADEAAGTARAPKGFRIAQDKAAVSPKPLKKGVMYRVHSKGSKARLSRRF